MSAPESTAGTEWRIEGVLGQQSPLGARLRALDWSRMAMGSLGVACVIAIWWLAAFIIADNVILPSPVATGRTLWHFLNRPYPARGDTLLGDTAISLVRILIGFAWGALVGTVLGAMMAAIRPLRLVVDPLIELARPLPPLAFIPLL
ncbi:MAG: ABC transporter permease, partial [Acetobacteraceae bacterium]